MRILYFLDDGQFFGGAANTLLQQAILMKNKRHEVALVVSNYEYEEMDEKYYSICKRSGIVVMRAPFQISSHPEDIDIVCVQESYEKLYVVIEQFQPDILHSIQINPLVEIISRQLGIPHIMNIYQIAEEFFTMEYENYFPHYHICDSEYYKKIWERFIKLDSICIRTVVDRCLRYPIGIHEKGKIVYCCVGHICKRKNQLEVIKAFQRALQEGIQGKLVICGHDEGTYAQTCKNYVVEKNLTTVIEFTGFKESMEEEYQKADVLICGSTNESYPNVISEAMAHELVVISTPVAGVPEVIKDGVNGYLCEGYLANDIYKKIIQYNRERTTDKMLQIKANIDRTFKEEHLPEIISKKLETYYWHVLVGYHMDLSLPKYADFTRIFGEVLCCYRKNIKKFSDYKMVRKKLWYIYHIKEVIMQRLGGGREDIYIWGTGRLSTGVMEIVEVFFEELQIKGFIDTYKQGEFCGHPIFSPESILQKEGIIFVGTVNGQEEIIEVLKNNYKQSNRDYFVLVPRIW